MLYFILGSNLQFTNVFLRRSPPRVSVDELSVWGIDRFSCVLSVQGLQRRATPHPSELKVMKKVIEEKRNEAYTSCLDGEPESPGIEV